MTFVLYVIARNDLPSCNTGKMMAQVAHAATHVESYFNNQPFLPYTEDQTDYHEVMEHDDSMDEQIYQEMVDLKFEYDAWKHESKQGFGTTIVLEANIDTIKQLNEQLSHNDRTYNYIIIDPTYPYQCNSEIAQLIDLKYHTVAPRVDGDITYCWREEATCMVVFGDKVELFPYLSKLSLHS
jgi:peptidyl-tRNA hydrolase